MADTEAKQPVETVQHQDDDKSLKYLEFVQVAAIYITICFSTLYEYAKENSGPLKPGVQTVEGTVKAVVGPVYERFHDVPFELLKFVDRKVNDSLSELNGVVPSLVKQASSQALTVVQLAPEVAQAVAAEVQRAGVIDTAKNITKDLYTKFEPVAEQYAVSFWRSLNQLPLFPQLAQVIIPTAAYWLEKYNEAVYYTADRGYAVAFYLPVIPLEKIGRVFDEAKDDPNVPSNGEVPVCQQ
ncbi:hypothetical protein UlMin_031231 [Ulmus minor]